MIPFIDLEKQQDRIINNINNAIADVLAHKQFILGKEVQELERQLQEFCRVEHCISCANGTDALTLALMAAGFKAGDGVLIPSFGFVATAEAPAQLGIVPVFVDVDERSYNIEPSSLKNAMVYAKKNSLNIKGIIAVDLFGNVARYDAIQDIANEENLIVIADGAQSFGASYNHKKVGTLADYTTTSFFPAKPFGCYGDGGAVFTNDREKAALLTSLRFHGKGVGKYDNVRIGLNSRLDTLQAAILIEKLTIFEDEIDKRQKVAEFYHSAFQNNRKIKLPQIQENCLNVWAQYTIQIENRNEVMSKLYEKGIPSMVYYDKPLHMQEGYKHYPRGDDLSICEKLTKKVLSIPMHPYLDQKTQEYIAEQVLVCTR